MPTALLDDPILTRFAAEVRAAYGDRVERIVLFGSRARGDHEPDSDYDVAVFIHEPGSLWQELGILCKITRKIEEDTGADISPKPLVAGSYDYRTPLMGEIRRDGCDL
ncbi:MAG TPA: nucleotidyltransferase domain-containing protein [Stellaceae bacterium]|jgi:predicted nucleotidyltransferase|nr:nucleotidyltransferase domain-containing protein [Stellaceae bacterium]